MYKNNLKKVTTLNSIQADITMYKTVKIIKRVHTNGLVEISVKVNIMM